MKRKLKICSGILVIIIVFLFGFNTIQENKDSDTETIIIDNNGNRLEPETSDKTIYGK